MPYDNFGDFVQDFSDVETTGEAPGMMPDELDTSSMFPDSMGGLGAAPSDFDSTSLMPDRAGPLTKDG
jgi:hypothetical protein